MAVPVISVAQMREWERATWATGQTETAVIARVGEALGRRAMALTRAGDGILILAGKGHNGDDARAMQEHLLDRDVRAFDVANPITAMPELENAFQSRPRLIVDGLFGIGLNRTLDRPWVELIDRVNGAEIPVLAIDVPSGLDAQTGQALGSAIRATWTATVGAPKPGFLVDGASDYVGRIEVVNDVGLVACPIKSELQWTEPRDFSAFPPSRPLASHKGTFGHVAIVAGSLGYHGASVLAARGAQRACPGLITLFPQPEIYAPVASQLQAVMVDVWSDEVEFLKFTALLFGPGLAANGIRNSVREACRREWNRAAIPIVVDASALGWLSPDEEPMSGIRVMTPHPGEAARLLECSTVDVQRNRLSALRAVSRRFGHCWVVLKGQHTLVGRAEGEVFVNGSGSADLAQGGTGDLLAGFIAGWLAQPTLQRDPLRALRYAVWAHGAAADRLSARRKHWIVEELADELGNSAPSS